MKKLAKAKKLADETEFMSDDEMFEKSGAVHNELKEEFNKQMSKQN